jgi:hypothetical protein
MELRDAIEQAAALARAARRPAAIDDLSALARIPVLR